MIHIRRVNPVYVPILCLAPTSVQAKYQIPHVGALAPVRILDLSRQTDSSNALGDKLPRTFDQLSLTRGTGVPLSRETHRQRIERSCYFVPRATGAADLFVPRAAGAAGYQLQE